MKKLFLLILFFTSLTFAQLVKPGGGTTKDSLTYTLPKTIGNSFLSPSFYAKNNIMLFQNTQGLLYSDVNKNLFLDNSFVSFNGLGNNNYSLGSQNFVSRTGSGVQDIAIGNSNQTYSNGGSNNITIGYGNLHSNSYGGGNIGIGYQTLDNNSVGLFGSNNIAIGQYAQNNSGSTNGAISLGYYSGYNSVSTNSITIGYNSYYQGSGTNTIAIGYNSCYKTNTDTSIYIGMYAGQNSNTYNSGSVNTQGNIYIGYQSGINSGSLTTNKHDIYLGYQVGNAKNEKYIFRLGDESVQSTDLIYGDMLNKLVLFGVKKLGIDTSGTLAYKTIVGSTNRTAGIDSLLNGVDTVRTTAYDANSLVFITDLSAAGTPGHQYIDKINSVPGSYFIVLSKSALDTSLFNWFILKTY